jgi:hypothetical protein
MKGDVMKQKRFWLIVCIVTLSILSIYWINKAWAVKANTQELTEHYINSLRNSNGVWVWLRVKIIKTSDVTEDKLLSQKLQKKLQTDIELELRRHGIKVLTEKEVKKVIGRPTLSIEIYAEQLDNDYYAGSFKIKHAEDALLVRNKLPAWAICWDSGLLIYRVLPDKLRKSVIDEVRTYINDYLAANPKETEKKGLTIREMIEKKKAEAKLKP